MKPATVGLFPLINIVLSCNSKQRSYVFLQKPLIVPHYALLDAMNNWVYGMPAWGGSAKIGDAGCRAAFMQTHGATLSNKSVCAPAGGGGYGNVKGCWFGRRRSRSLQPDHKFQFSCSQHCAIYIEVFYYFYFSYSASLLPAISTYCLWYSSSARHALQSRISCCQQVIQTGRRNSITTRSLCHNIVPA